MKGRSRSIETSDPTPAEELPDQAPDEAPDQAPDEASDRAPDEAADDVRDADAAAFERTVRLLERAVEDCSLLAHLPDELRIRLMTACGRLSRPSHRERRVVNRTRRKARRDSRRAHDEAILDRTGIRRQRIEMVFPTPDPEDNAADSNLWIESDARERASAEDATDAASHAPSSESAGPTSDRSGKAARPRLIEPRTCYTCKADYHDVHLFYDALCPSCAELNWRKRNQTVDLEGRVALLTGGRVKIGYQVGIKMLRAGCRLVVTTRFPRDAASRYAREPDFDRWKDRLEIYGLDLRHTPSVEALASKLLDRYERLDFLINNACQTVRRPPGFYAHLMEGETLSYDALAPDTRSLLRGHEELARAAAEADAGGDSRRALASSGPSDGPNGGRSGGPNGGPSGGPNASDPSRPAESPPSPAEAPSSGTGTGTGTGTGDRSGARATGLERSAELSQVPLVAGDTDVGEHLFPTGKLDADLQQVDLRDVNSWRLPLANVPTVELLEVHLVNAVAPFVLNARLKPLMARVPSRDKHVVNVSAMEGQFYRAFKTDKHPHTNMAKAALNMMTRTSAPDYFRDGIHMNSVDTGWITDEDPMHLTLAKREEHGFHPPLDHVDAAARICDPIFDGFLTGKHVWGQFLKDYRSTRW